MAIRNDKNSNSCALEDYECAEMAIRNDENSNLLSSKHFICHELSESLNVFIIFMRLDEISDQFLSTLGSIVSVCSIFCN